MYSTQTAELMREVNPGGRWVANAFPRIVTEMRKRRRQLLYVADTAIASDYRSLHQLAMNNIIETAGWEEKMGLLMQELVEGIWALQNALQSARLSEDDRPTFRAHKHYFANSIDLNYVPSRLV